MINYQQEGDILTLVAPSGGVVSGGVYKIGSFIVVAAAAVAQTLPFEGKRRGVFRVTKVGSQAWTQGVPVYWDNGNTRFTTTSGGNTLAGAAVEAVGAGAGETTGVVLLDGTVR
jgi:predicted RecA/RadA family phage recombinase